MIKTAEKNTLQVDIICQATLGGGDEPRITIEIPDDKRGSWKLLNRMLQEKPITTLGISRKNNLVNGKEFRVMQVSIRAQVDTAGSTDKFDATCTLKFLILPNVASKYFEKCSAAASVPVVIARNQESVIFRATKTEMLSASR